MTSSINNKKLALKIKPEQKGNACTTENVSLKCLII